MERFRPYIEQMGITTRALLDRIELIYYVASAICPEEIEQMFITDYINRDNARAYESIWFFSKGYCLEAKNFITDYNIDIVPIKVKRFELISKDYDFKNAVEESRLQLSVGFEEQIFGDLKAAKENCDVLRDITLRYIKPKLAM